MGRALDSTWKVAKITSLGASELFYAERIIDGKREQHDVKAHCLACAKVEVLVKFGGQVDSRGTTRGQCGKFLKAAVFAALADVKNDQPVAEQIAAETGATIVEIPEYALPPDGAQIAQTPEVEARPEGCTDMHLQFLDDLREGGEINMFGAYPVLASAFRLDKVVAKKIWSYWASTFGKESR